MHVWCLSECNSTAAAHLKAVSLSSNLFAAFFTPWIADPEELREARLKVLR